MACDCMTKMDEELAKHNSRLQVTITFGSGEMKAFPYIGTKKLNTRAREKMGAIATFCPFCGVKYEPENGGKV